MSAYPEVLSPHRFPRTVPIDKITIHHAAAVGVSARQIADHFTSPLTYASANYCVGYNGEIVISVPEDMRAVTSSNVANDNRAVTIEVANSGAAPNWPISDKAWESLVQLVAEICARNSIDKLIWTGDRAGNLTTHNMFAATACPGPYLYGRMPELAEEVNKILDGGHDMFNTLEECPEWAREAVGWAVERQILRGDGYGLGLDYRDLRVITWLYRASKEAGGT